MNLGRYIWVKNRRSVEFWNSQAQGWSQVRSRLPCDHSGRGHNSGFLVRAMRRFLISFALRGRRGILEVAAKLIQILIHGRVHQ